MLIEKRQVQPEGNIFMMSYYTVYTQLFRIHVRFYLAEISIGSKVKTELKQTAPEPFF